MSQVLYNQPDNHINQERNVVIILVEHTNNLFSVRFDNEHIKPNLFIRRHEYRIVTSEQVKKLQQTTGREIQLLLHDIWHHHGN